MPLFPNFRGLSTYQYKNYEAQLGHPRVVTLSENIRAYLKLNKMTQRELVERVQAISKPLGISFGGDHGEALLSHYIHGRCSPKVEHLYVLSLAMGISMSDLAGYGNPYGLGRRPLPFRREAISRRGHAA